MLGFPNDRFLSTDMPLRMLVLAPELGATTVTVSRALDLRLSYVLRDRATGNPLDVESTRVLKEQDVAYLRVPWSYAELSMKGVRPGSYILQAIQATDVVAQTNVVVLEPEALSAALDELANEKSGAVTAMESGETLRRQWEAAWDDLYSYLKVPIPTHIAVALPQSLKPASSAPQRFSQEAFRWVLFHVHRLVFGAVLLGGTAAFTQSGDNPQQFRYTIQSRIPIDPGIVVAHLAQLRRLIKATEYSVSFDWKLEAPVPPFSQRTILDIQWSGPPAVRQH